MVGVFLFYTLHDHNFPLLPVSSPFLFFTSYYCTCNYKQLTMTTEDNNGTLVFGKPSEAPTTNKEAATETAENKESVKPNANQDNGQESDNIEVIGAKPKTETPGVSTKDTEAATDKTDKTDSEKQQDSENTDEKGKATSKESNSKEDEFKVTFDTKKEEPKTEDKEQKRESASMSEEQVLAFIKQNNPDFKDINTLADLSKKETLPEPVAKFKDFHEKTGRGIQDFHNLQRNWKDENPETAIREYLKLSEPNITDEDINLQMDLISIPSEDDEANFSDHELKQRKLEWNKTHRKAVSFLEEKSKEYETPLTSKQEAPKPPTADEIAKAMRPYWDERDKSLKDFNEITVSTSLGDIKIPIDEDDKKLISNYTQSQEAFFKDWQSKDSPVGLDTAKVVRGTAQMVLHEKILKEAISQTRALTLENLSKENRNVKLDGIKQRQQEPKKGSVEILGGNPKEERFGQPLFK